jgi:hypothetical protein
LLFVFSSSFFADFALTEFRLGKDSWGGYKRALHCPFLVTNHAALPTALLLTVQPQPSNQTSHLKINIELFGCFVKIVKCCWVWLASMDRIGQPKVKQNHVGSGDYLVISLNGVWHCLNSNSINGAAST